MDAGYNMLNEWYLMSRETRPAGALASPIHYHHSYEMFVMLKGETTMLIDDELTDISANEVLLIRPDALHKNNGGTRHERYAVHFTDRYLRHYFSEEAAEILTREFDNKKRAIKGDAFLGIVNILRDMENEPELMFAHLAELIVRICSKQNQTAPHKPRNYRLTSKIFSYINDNYANIESLDDIARSAHISKQYLCSVVKKETGLTVSDYLNEVRINKACELLQSGNLKITEIASECGYNSSIYFGRVFKEIVHMTPGEYRKYVKTI